MQPGDGWAAPAARFTVVVTAEAVVGAQRPRVLWAPSYARTLGPDAVEFGRQHGVELDPWQALVFEHGLGVGDDGRWSAFEVGVEVPRQNGKGEIEQVREAFGLFELPERFLIHSAHQFDTSLEAFLRLEDFIAGSPELSSKVARVSRSHGEEGIRLKDGSRIRFRTRTKGGGRGFSCDCLILDEAMVIAESSHGALLPTLSARPNPQVWYAGSAVDQFVHEHGVVFARIRERGLRGGDRSLAYFEWSLGCELEEATTERVAEDPEAWAQANPGLGIRISAEHVEREQRSLDPRTFAVERLGVGDWPSTDVSAAEVLPVELWRGLTDVRSRLAGEPRFAFDVTPTRSAAAIGVAGKRSDGLGHVEVVDHRRGTSWLAERVAELVARHRTGGIVCDTAGPAAALVPALEQLGVEVVPVNAREHAQACGMLFDAATGGTVRHLGTQELEDALRGARTRPLGDAWAWSRKNSAVDISPLVASTLALWASETQPQSVYAARGFVVI